MRAFSLYNPLRLSDDLLRQRLSDDLLQQENAKFVISVFLTLSQKKIQSKHHFPAEIWRIYDNPGFSLLCLLPLSGSSGFSGVRALIRGPPHLQVPTKRKQQWNSLFFKSLAEILSSPFFTSANQFVSISSGTLQLHPFVCFVGPHKKSPHSCKSVATKRSVAGKFERLSQIGIVITLFQPTESRCHLTLLSSEYNYLCFRCLGFSSGLLPRSPCFRSQHSNKHPHDSATSGTPNSVVCWFLQRNYDIPKKSSKISKKKEFYLASSKVVSSKLSWHSFQVGPVLSALQR